MNTVAIVGVGLIGGSFALALRRAGFRGAILGVSSPAAVAEALELGIIDEALPLEPACERADLIYLSPSIQRIIDLLPVINTHLRDDALITDAGSTKVEIVESARAHITRGLFIGGHPMAGKEVRGVRAAEAGLFERRPYVLTPLTPSAFEDSRVIDFVEWVRRIGARPVILSAVEHDAAVAYTSHLPQLISTALALTLEGVENATQVAGPAVLELTRLALSHYDIWRDIFVTNDTHIVPAINECIRNLQILRDNLGSDGVADAFNRSAAVARSLRNGYEKS